MSLLRAVVFCTVVLVGVGARADDVARVTDTPAADHPSDIPVAASHHQEDSGAVGLAGTTPSGKDDYDLEADPASSTSDEDYWSTAAHDGYDDESDYWGSDDYGCNYYDEEGYDDDYGRYASEWFSGDSGDDLGGGSGVAQTAVDSSANPQSPYHTAMRSGREGGVREMDVQ